MSKESIIQRIISDAEEEAARIIAEADKIAEKAVFEAEERARRNLAGTAAEAAQRAKAVIDGKAATARLDCAKIALAEKRRVIDGVYAEALKSLNALGEKQALDLAAYILETYAEEGDEIVFASGYKYAAAVAQLAVVKNKGLKISKSAGKFAGGFILNGKVSDKDVSYTALLAADREQNVSAIAEKLFSAG